MSLTLLSVDAESNGLHGQPFAIGAALVDDDGERETFVGRCPVAGPVDEWVAENVLPALVDLPESAPTYADLLGDFYGWRQEHGTDVSVVAHVPWPVEARLFSDLYGSGDAELAFEGPFPLLDVASMLWLAGESATSVDDYLTEYGLPAPGGSAHHPLYDARVAELVARHLFKRLRRGRG